MQVNVKGKPTNMQPGDWVEVGKQLALQWLSNGSAAMFGQELQNLFPKNSGIILHGAQPDAMRQRFSHVLEGVEVISCEPGVPFVYNVIWDTKLAVRHELIAVGLNLLAQWDVVIPLFDYTLLAMNVGTEIEQEMTKTIIHDLRVHLQDTRFICARQNATTQRLFEVYAAERQRGDNAMLAWLRATYQVKPLLLAVPVTWTSGKVDYVD